MRSWSRPSIPALPGTRPDPRVFDSVEQKAKPTQPERRRLALRLRHHPVRRHPPRPRRHLPRLRPGRPGVAGRRATTSTTCRTSPTSTTRCWSAPRATARTGVSSPRERPSCSATTWRRCGSSRRDHYVGAVEAIAQIADAVKTLLDRGTAYRVDEPGCRARRLLRHAAAPRPARGSAARATWTATTMLEPVRASAAATRTAPASGTRSTRCCGASERRGRAGLGLAGRPRPPRLAHRVHRHRAGAPRRRRSTVHGGGSDLIFPHHEFSAAHAAALTGRFGSRTSTSHAGMIGLPGREDEQVAGQPRLRLAAASPTASTRGRSGWRCWPSTTTVGLGVDRRPPAHRGGAAGFLGGLGVARDDGNRDRRSVDELRVILANDLDTPAALRRIDEYIASGAPATPLLVDAIDALLGIRLG